MLDLQERKLLDSGEYMVISVNDEFYNPDLRTVQDSKQSECSRHIVSIITLVYSRQIRFHINFIVSSLHLYDNIWCDTMTSNLTYLHSMSASCFRRLQSIDTNRGSNETVHEQKDFIWNPSSRWFYSQGYFKHCFYYLKPYETKNSFVCLSFMLERLRKAVSNPNRNNLFTCQHVLNKSNISFFLFIHLRNSKMMTNCPNHRGMNKFGSNHIAKRLFQTTCWVILSYLATRTRRWTWSPISRFYK